MRTSGMGDWGIVYGTIPTLLSLVRGTVLNLVCQRDVVIAQNVIEENHTRYSLTVPTVDSDSREAAVE